MYAKIVLILSLCILATVLAAGEDIISDESPPGVPPLDGALPAGPDNMQLGVIENELQVVVKQLDKVIKKHNSAAAQPITRKQMKEVAAEPIVKPKKPKKPKHVKALDKLSFTNSYNAEENEANGNNVAANLDTVPQTPDKEQPITTTDTSALPAINPVASAVSNAAKKPEKKPKNTIKQTKTKNNVVPPPKKNAIVSQSVPVKSKVPKPKVQTPLKAMVLPKSLPAVKLISAKTAQAPKKQTPPSGKQVQKIIAKFEKKSIAKQVPPPKTIKSVQTNAKSAPKTAPKKK
jgi:hypothetical protein